MTIIQWLRHIRREWRLTRTPGVAVHFWEAGRLLALYVLPGGPWRVAAWRFVRSRDAI